MPNETPNPPISIDEHAFDPPGDVPEVVPAPIDAIEAAVRLAPLMAAAPLAVPRPLKVVYDARTMHLRTYRFRSVFTPTDGGRMHTLERGLASPKCATWVYVHGFASECTGWGGVLRRMRRRCTRMVALDLPGHGRSDLPTEGLTAERVMRGAEQVFQARFEKNERLVLVANSMGGIGVLRLLRHYRHQVIGLVLIDPAGAPMSPDEVSAVLDLFTLDTPQRALEFVDKLFPGGVRGRAFVANVLRRYLSQEPIMQLLRVLPEFRPFEPHDLADLPPTLFIWGGSDFILPPSSKAFFLKHLNPHKTTVIAPPHFGHAPFLDYGAEVTRYILDWATQQPDMLLPV